MATLQTHLPASLRSTPPSRHANPGNMNEVARPYLVAGRRGRTALVGRTAFEPLAKESEDAKITGATRSLDRRLLALNLRGSKTLIEVLTETRIA